MHKVGSGPSGAFHALILYSWSLQLPTARFLSPNS